MSHNLKKTPEISGARFITRAQAGGAVDVALEYTVPNGSGVALESTVLARCRSPKIAALLLDALRADVEGPEEALDDASEA